MNTGSLGRNDLAHKAPPRGTAGHAVLSNKMSIYLLQNLRFKPHTHFEPWGTYRQIYSI